MVEDKSKMQLNKVLKGKSCGGRQRGMVIVETCCGEGCDANDLGT